MNRDQTYLSNDFEDTRRDVAFPWHLEVLDLYVSMEFFRLLLTNLCNGPFPGNVYPCTGFSEML